MGNPSFPGVKNGRRVKLIPHPLLVASSRKSRVIPLLPLWAVQPVQSISACTTVHFTFTYTSNTPMGRTASTEHQCLYKGAPLPLPIPLLPLWAVRSVQSISASTRVHFTFTFTYTSTPPMGRTACTEPQCLYIGAPLPLPIPLLPLRAVRLVQSLSACTTVNLYLYLYLYSPYGPYALYRASVPVQGCTFIFTFTMLLVLQLNYNPKVCWLLTSKGKICRI